MIQFFLLNLIFIFSIFFMNMTHPLSLGLMLLFQTILICMLTGLMTKTFWYSYILYLVFLGGMLILFIYVVSLASNELFYLSMNLIYNFMIILTIMFITMFIMDFFFFSFNSPNLEMFYNLNKIIIYNENSLTLTKLYNYPSFFISIMLMNYLLVTLIITVKITDLFKGPIRTLN